MDKGRLELEDLGPTSYLPADVARDIFIADASILSCLTPLQLMDLSHYIKRIEARLNDTFLLVKQKRYRNQKVVDSLMKQYQVCLTSPLLQSNVFAQGICKNKVQRNGASKNQTTHSNRLGVFGIEESTK
jgi:hypothetical protein